MDNHISEMEKINDSDLSTELTYGETDSLYDEIRKSGDALARMVEIDAAYDEWLRLQDAGNAITFQNFCRNRGI